MKRLLPMLMLGAAVSASATDDPAYYVAGVGTDECGKFLAGKDAGNTSQMNLYVTWTWGYLAAYNRFATRLKQPTLRPPDYDAIVYHFDRYCRNNPLSAVAGGADVLIGNLGGPRATHSFKE